MTRFLTDREVLARLECHAIDRPDTTPIVRRLQAMVRTMGAGCIRPIHAAALGYRTDLCWYRGYVVPQDSVPRGHTIYTVTALTVETPRTLDMAR